MDSISLPSKFNQHIIGHADCKAPADLASRLKSCFENEILAPCESKKNIGSFPSLKEWIIKGQRTDIATTHDTHLYRVRKARKCATTLEQRGWKDRAVVATKYLYNHEGKWYVVAQKLKIAEIRPTMNDGYISEEDLNNASIPNENKIEARLRLSNDSSKTRPISPDQAEVYATLAFEDGSTDLNFLNLRYTEDERVAIFDTEPHKRVIKKATFQSRLMRIVFDKSIVDLQFSLIGTAKLKGNLTTDEARLAVEKIENRYVLKGAALLAFKTTLAALAFLYVKKLTTNTALVVGIRVLLGAHIAARLVQGANLAIFYKLNRSGPMGLNILVGMEMQGQA